MLTYQRMQNYTRDFLKAYQRGYSPDSVIPYLNHFENVGQISLEREKELVKEALDGDFEDLEEPIMTVEKKLQETRTRQERILDLLIPIIESLIDSIKKENETTFMLYRGKLSFFAQLYKEEMSDSLYSEIDEMIYKDLHLNHDVEDLSEKLWSIFNKLCIEWEAK